MATFDPYESCPCGSGKKFKWCCQPIHEEIVKAFRLEEEGQHEAAMRAMETVVAAHPNNPEAWGRKALLLYEQQRLEDAEAALQKAFEVNAKYPYGHYLRGQMRHQEGEIGGALILFRRAAEYYDPSARMVLANIQAMIFDCEMKLNHPLAGRAALTLAARFDPANENFRKGLNQVFGDQSRLPAVARQEYQYKPLPASAAPERKPAWQKALGAAGTGKLTDAVSAFQQLTEQDPQDAAAWYNLGLTWAWLGNQAAAVEAMDRYVSLETDENRASQTWALVEVLRCGQGMEDQADIVENVASFVLKQVDPFVKFLEELQQQQRLVGAQVNQQEGILTGLILEKLPPPLAPELAAKQNPRLGAAMMLIGNLINLSNDNKEVLDQVAEEVRQAMGGAIGDSTQVRGPARFTDIFSEVMIFPRGVSDQEQAQTRIRENFERFYEEKWLHRPLKSLGGVAPLDAVGHPVLKKKVSGIVQFLQECAALNRFTYDFDRLRRKLGLLEAHIESAETSATGPALDTLGTAELAGLDVETLAADQLEQAYQAALKLDARDLAGKFAGKLVSLPSRPEHPDRYTWFNHLIQLDQAAGNLDAALDRVNEGEKDDCSHNEGRRRNDYELRRGQLQAKKGDVAQARETFDRLIARVPSEVRYQGAAAEAMLSARQAKDARQYAEKGLAGARQQNNRDQEGYFLELVGAAQKQGG